MNILQLRAIVSPTLCYHVHSLKKEKSEKSRGEGVGIEKKKEEKGRNCFLSRGQLMFDRWVSEFRQTICIVLGYHNQLAESHHSGFLGGEG